MWLSFIVSSFSGKGWVLYQSPTPLLASSSTSAPSPPSRCPLSGSSGSTTAGHIAGVQAHPCSFWHRLGRSIPGKSSGPTGSCGCAVSACLVAKACWGTLSIVLGKQQLLSQDPTHHKSPWSPSELLPVCIIFPVQLLFFTPACSFSLESHKIIKIKVWGMYWCA